MAFGASEVFRSFVADSLKNTQPFDLDGDSIKVALFNNSVVPDQDAVNTATAYNAGTWLTANELSSGAAWAAGGVALAGKAINDGSPGVVFFDATDTASGAGATMTNVFGCLVYDDTLTATPGPAKAGICFNSFGGANSVTNGVFTIVWPANGIFRLTL